jgi:hypothetical protein
VSQRELLRQKVALVTVRHRFLDRARGGIISLTADDDVLISLERSEPIAATCGAVWQLVSDPPHHPQWSDELVKAWWVDERRGEGAQFVGRNRIESFGDWIREPLEWETTSTVLDATQERRFSWLVGDPDDPVARWTFELHPSDGATLLRHDVRVYPRGLARTIGENPDEDASIIDERRKALDQSLRTALHRIRGLLEPQA